MRRAFFVLLLVEVVDFTLIEGIQFAKLLVVAVTARFVGVILGATGLSLVLHYLVSVFVVFYHALALFVFDH